MALKYIETGGDATGGFEFFQSTTGTVAVDTSIKHSGPSSLKFGASAASHFAKTVNGSVTTSSTTSSAGRVSFWVYIDAAISGAGIWICSPGGTTLNRLFHVAINTARQLLIIAPSNSTLSTGTQSLSIGTWYRVCVAWDITNLTTNTINVFVDGDATNQPAVTNANLVNAWGAGEGNVNVGWISSPGTTAHIYVDDIVSDDDSSCTDMGDVHATAKRPISANTNNFDTTIGSASNRWEYVNERPLLETNGLSHNATSDVQENFTLQAASVGDADLTGATILGFAGWLWAKRGSLAGTITHRSSHSANNNTVAITTPAAGDLIIVWAYRNNNTTAPSLEGTFTNIGTLGPGGSANSMRVGYKIATGSETSTGVWSNATNIVCSIYRSTGTISIGANASNSGNDTALVYPSLTLQADNNGSWVVGGGAAKAATAGMNGTTTALTSNRTNQTIVNGLDTDGPVSSFSAQTLNVTGSGRWITWSVQIKAGTVGAGTPKIMSNGTETAITLTDSPALYTALTDSSSYPSNSAGIGMRSANAEPDTFFYEGGTLVAYIPGVSSNVTATPATASLTITRFAPTVTATDPKTATPTTASLTATAFAPTVTASDHKTATPASESLSVTGFAPTVTATANQLVTPSTASLTLSAFAPTVSATAHQTVTPSAESLSTTAFAPTVATTANQAVVPGTQSLTTAAFAPTVSATDLKTVVPGLAELELDAFAPTVTAGGNQTATPVFAELELTAFEPTVTAFQGVTAVPGSESLTVTGFAPTVSATQHTFTFSVAAELDTAFFAPSVQVTQHQTVTVGVVDLEITAFAPTVEATQNRLVIPGPAALVLTATDPVVTATDHQVVTPGAASLSLTGFSPSVSAVADTQVVPGTAELEVTLFTPTVETTANQLVVPGAAALVVTAFQADAAATAHVTVTPAVKSFTFSGFAPTVTAITGVTVVPLSRTLTMAFYTSTVTATGVGPRLRTRMGVPIPDVSVPGVGLTKQASHFRFAALASVAPDTDPRLSPFDGIPDKFHFESSVGVLTLIPGTLHPNFWDESFSGHRVHPSAIRYVDEEWLPFDTKSQLKSRLSFTEPRTPVAPSYAPLNTFLAQQAPGHVWTMETLAPWQVNEGISVNFMIHGTSKDQPEVVLAIGMKKFGWVVYGDLSVGMFHETATGDWVEIGTVAYSGGPINKRELQTLTILPLYVDHFAFYISSTTTEGKRERAALYTGATGGQARSLRLSRGLPDFQPTFNTVRQSWEKHKGGNISVSMMGLGYSYVLGINRVRYPDIATCYIQPEYFPYFDGERTQDGTVVPYLWNNGGTVLADLVTQEAFAAGPDTNPVAVRLTMESFGFPGFDGVATPELAAYSIRYKTEVFEPADATEDISSTWQLVRFEMSDTFIPMRVQMKGYWGRTSENRNRITQVPRSFEISVDDVPIVVGFFDENRPTPTGKGGLFYQMDGWDLSKRAFDREVGMVPALNGHSIGSILFMLAQLMGFPPEHIQIEDGLGEMETGSLPEDWFTLIETQKPQAIIRQLQEYYAYLRVRSEGYNFVASREVPWDGVTEPALVFTDSEEVLQYQFFETRITGTPMVLKMRSLPEFVTIPAKCHRIHASGSEAIGVGDRRMTVWQTRPQVWNDPNDPDFEGRKEPAVLSPPKNVSSSPEATTKLVRAKAEAEGVPERWLRFEGEYEKSVKPGQLCRYLMFTEEGVEDMGVWRIKEMSIEVENDARNSDYELWRCSYELKKEPVPVV